MAESANEQSHIDRCSDPLVASAIPYQSYSLFTSMTSGQNVTSLDIANYGLLLANQYSLPLATRFLIVATREFIALSKFLRAVASRFAAIAT
jgi:hypothetical protein